MVAYHGTVAEGLTELRPFASPHSNLDYPCVYLSTYKALAAIYIWNRQMCIRDRTTPAFRRYVTSHERWEDRWIKSRD